MFLGFDISTSCTAWSILSEDGKLIAYDFVNLSKCKTKDLGEKLDFFLAEFEQKIAPFKDQIVFIGAEDFLRKFTKGKSSIHVLLTLACFNFLLCYTLERKLGKKIKKISFADARNLAGIQFLQKTKPKDKKEKIRQYCDKKYQIDWLVNKRGNVDVKNFDISDSILISEFLQRTNGTGKAPNLKANLSRFRIPGRKKRIRNKVPRTRSSQKKA